MSYIQFYHLEQFVEGLDPLFRDESDRGAAVVAACFLEDFIEEVLDHYTDAPILHPRNDPPYKKNTFAYHIDLLRRKELVDAERVAHFHLVRDLRNVFAHNLRAASFGAVAGLLRAHLGDIPDAELKAAFVGMLKDCTNVLIQLSHEKFTATKNAHFKRLNDRMTAYRVLEEISRGETGVVFVEMRDGLALYRTGGLSFLTHVNGTQAVSLESFQIGVDSDWEVIAKDIGDADEMRAAWNSLSFPPAELPHA